MAPSERVGGGVGGSKVQTTSTCAAGADLSCRTARESCPSTRSEPGKRLTSLGLCRCGQRWNFKKREPPTEAAALFYVSLLGSERAIKEVDKEYQRYLRDQNMSAASKSSSAEAESQEQSATPAPADPAPSAR